MKLCLSSKVVFCVLVITVLIACKSKEEPSQSIEVATVAESINPLEECSSSLPVAYGGSASSACFLKCFTETQNKDGCHSVCDHFVAELYPRTLLPIRKEEAELVSEMSEQCESLSMNEQQPLAATDWLTLQEPVLTSLATSPRDLEVYDSADILRLFLTFESAALTLQPVLEEVPEYQKFYSQLRKELCLRQLIAVTQLAVLQAATRDDLYSEMYYRTIESLLLAESLEVGGGLPQLYGEAVKYSVEQLTEL